MADWNPNSYFDSPSAPAAPIGGAGNALPGAVAAEDNACTAPPPQLEDDDSLAGVSPPSSAPSRPGSISLVSELESEGTGAAESPAAATERPPVAATSSEVRTDEGANTANRATVAREGPQAASTSRRNSVADVRERAAPTSALAVADSTSFFRPGLGYRALGTLLIAIGGAASSIFKLLSKGPMKLGAYIKVAYSDSSSIENPQKQAEAVLRHGFKGAKIPAVLTSPIGAIDALLSLFGRLGGRLLQAGGVSQETVEGVDKYFKSSLEVMYNVNSALNTLNEQQPLRSTSPPQS